MLDTKDAIPVVAIFEVGLCPAVEVYRLKYDDDEMITRICRAANGNVL